MIRAVHCEASEVRHVLERAKSQRTDSTDSFCLDDLLARGQVFKVTAPAGETVGAYVLAARGPVVWVLAAAGNASFDLVAAMVRLVTNQAGGFEQIGFRTERRGLVRKALTHGFQVTGRQGPAYFLRKNIR
jgi:hypothetical protein